MSRPRVAGQRGWPAAVQPARQAWRAADFPAAKHLAAALVAAGEGGDHARHLLVLACCALGDRAGAVAAHTEISRGHRRLTDLDEPMLWAHVHDGDLAGAMAFAQRRGLTRSAAVEAPLRLSLAHPPTLAITSVADIGFTDDALTPFMPGFDGAVNGRPTVLRLDTGGAYLHVSGQQATDLGIEVVTREREYAALSRHWIGSGIADVDLGPVRMHNVPVAVHEHGLQSAAIAAATGVELGPLIGTSLLRQFLATVDTPQARLFLSPRGDADARARHLALVPTDGHRVPFGVVLDHRIIAVGSACGADGVPMFVDSGLVAVSADQGQASMLAPRSTLDGWGVGRSPPQRFADLPGRLALGGARLDRATAMPVSGRTWRHLGHWDGVDVRALISWGFLRHFSLTIDHDRCELLLSPG